MAIQVPVTFDSATRKRDKSVSLRFTSNLEISTPDFMEMDKLVQQAGWMVFKPNEIDLEDIPEGDAPTEERKTKIQRLRAVMFLIHEKHHPGEKENFNSWWDAQFEKLLDKYKERLD